MKDALDLIKERLSKAEAKAIRAEKAWDSAKTEVADLRTAYRVMSELSGESPTPASSVSMGDRQKSILDLLGFGEASGRPPAEIYEKYKLIATEDISIDTFRTTIWRMKDFSFRDMFGFWIVKGDSGRYWKEPASMGAREHLVQANAPANEHEIDDEDDDAPF